MLCASATGLAAALSAPTPDSASRTEGPCQAFPSYARLCKSRIRSISRIRALGLSQASLHGDLGVEKPRNRATRLRIVGSRFKFGRIRSRNFGGHIQMNLGDCPAGFQLFKSQSGVCIDALGGHPKIAELSR